MLRRDFFGQSARLIAAVSSSTLRDPRLHTLHDEITIAAVGDCILTRRVSQIRDPRFLRIVKLLRNADCAVGNCEITFGDSQELEPAFKGRDLNLICAPNGADELSWMGFDLLGCANNHALDYGTSGLRSTLHHLARAGLSTAGAGLTLASATAPVYADTPAGRISLVNCTSAFPSWSLAEDARTDSNGRAGINPLHVNKTYQLQPTLFEQLKTINAALFCAPSHRECVQSDEVQFLDQRFVSGHNGVLTAPEPRDVERILGAISIAKRNARLVVTLIHAHDAADTDGPPEYLMSFARRCIDSGADIFFGAGPHVLGGIEIYEGKPICYSLGNFFFQYETLMHVPIEVYEANRLDGHTPDPSINHDAMGFTQEPQCWESVVAYFRFSGTRLIELTLHPITLGLDEPRFARGVPKQAADHRIQHILEPLVARSTRLGTHIAVSGGVGTIRLNVR